MPAKAEKPQEIEVRSVRVNKASIRAEWKQGDDEYGVTFHDNPLPTFYKAMEGLVPHVLTLSELPAKDADKIEVIGLTISAKNVDAPQATLIAKKKLKRNKRVLNIATPILPLYENEENKGADHMSEDEASAVEKAIKEIKKYISGDRAQGKLAFEDEENEKKGDKGPENVAEFPNLTEAAKS